MTSQSRSVIALTIVICCACCSLFAEEPLYLDKITINGLTTLYANEIVQSLNINDKQGFEPELIPVLQERIEAYLVKKGYYFSKIEQTEIIPAGNSKVELVFTISEGNSGYLNELRYSGNRYFSQDKINQLLIIPAANQIRITQIPEIETKILELYTTRGYVFASVKLDSLIAKDDRFDVVIGITEGPLFNPMEFSIRGNKVTKSSTILWISGLSKIEKVTPDDLIQAENNITSKPYIKGCRILPLDAKTLGIEVEEDKMTKAEGVLGMTTDPKDKSRKLTGLLNVQFLNLWGTDRALSLDWRSLKNNQQSLELTYHESGINKYPVAGDISFQRTIQDSAWIKIRTQLQVYYNTIYNKFGTDLYNETLYPDSKDTLEIVKTNNKSVSLFWEYLKSDYLPNPSSGYKLKIKSGWVFKEAGEDNKTIPVTELDAIGYIPLKKRIVLSTGVHYREISDAKIPQYEQYKLGGFHTVRGFPEEYESGWRTGWVNLELRYLLTRDSRIYLLLDKGLVQHQEGKVRTDLLGLGTGLSVKTKLGVMSISYALAYTEKRLSTISHGMLHIGLEGSF